MTPAAAARRNRFLGWNRPARELGLCVARSKTGFAATARTGLVHRVKDMAAIRDGDRLRFAARWLCGSTCRDVAPVAAPENGTDVCVRCAEVALRPNVVYRLYGFDGSLLYIGSSKRGGIERPLGHRARSWWPLVDTSRTLIEHFEHELQARAFESAAIRAEQPEFNVQGKGVAS